MEKVVLPAEKSQSLKNTQLGRELQRVFESQAISTHFQPIVGLKTRSIYAFEALTRGPENSALYSPANLFNVASEHDCLLEMDLMARRVSIKNFMKTISTHQNQAKLFLNISVSSLMNTEHRTGLTLDCLQYYGLNIRQVVIEITELQPVEDSGLFLNAIKHYRKMGFKVAIDDLGSGYNGLKLWSEVKPDFVKIDKHFIANIDKQADKYRFMETILTLAKSLGTKIIAEGVETEAELQILEKLGVDFVQGFLLKRPSPSTALTLDYQWRESIKDIASPKETVKLLCREAFTMSPDTSVDEVTEELLHRPGVEFVPIVEDGLVHGVVWRQELIELLASKFGRDLHGRKNISKVMDKAPLVFDWNTPLVEVSREITENGSYDKGTFIITEKGLYQGYGSFMELLRVITDLKIRSAQYANPLSGLPGNVPIQNTIQEYLDKQSAFVVIYVDVDNFKPYNDCYSFEQGDQVISELAKVLQDAVGQQTNFIGHVGGDDFVVVTPVLAYEEICERILTGFQTATESFYTQEDREHGGIYAEDRSGQQVFFPMMTLSLGVLLVYPGVFDHTQKLSSYATRAKKGAKSKGGNTYFVMDSRQVALLRA
ncbi:EAL and GGDEF domain-containing protein [Hydrogenovibrio sp. 3SP14C1]|uniref:GGDEF domain-containing protein n=1 Tax=Hydrogenovibrio sp. 3SP14C1 TaxID=3038774 RepID=UPI00241634F9|nr:bifunctional diguanylate cyclase/phosphodiesterase [Hydrogenovibrio sp. 3SP14C1]MDG4812678.1 EAL and GGDEF domain-containing protein [Hydrogenovibrio sp. 3SP14C1]